MPEHRLGKGALNSGGKHWLAYMQLFSVLRNRLNQKALSPLKYINYTMCTGPSAIIIGNRPK